MHRVHQLCTFGYSAKPITHGSTELIPLLSVQRPNRAYRKTLSEDLKMKKVLALIVAATMGLSSIAFAADTAAPAAAPAATDTMAAPAHGAKATHHKKEHKKATTKAPEQKAQAAKKHHKADKKAPVEQKAQAAKAKKHSKKAPEQKAQAAKKHHKDSKKAAAPAAK